MQPPEDRECRDSTREKAWQLPLQGFRVDLGSQHQGDLSSRSNKQPALSASRQTQVRAVYVRVRESPRSTDKEVLREDVRGDRWGKGGGASC